MADWAWRLKYNPNQPRVPSGSPQGGQWTSGSVEPTTFQGGSVSVYRNISDWGREHYGEWEDSLSFDEQQAIVDYTGHQYQEINGVLRGKEKDLSDRRKQRALANIDLIDAALGKASLDEPLLVRRGFCGSPECVDKFSRLQPGDTFKDNGYVSTSLGKATQQRVMAEIRLPVGAKGAYVGNIALNDTEGEFLLPRGSVFRVRQVNVSDDGRVVVVLDYQRVGAQ